MEDEEDEEKQDLQELKKFDSLIHMLSYCEWSQECIFHVLNASAIQGDKRLTVKYPFFYHSSIRQMMKTWSVKSKLADCCKSITPVSGSLNSSSR